MLKKIMRIAIVLLIIVLLVVIAMAVYYLIIQLQQPKFDHDFLSTLKGQVVFTRDNKDGVSDIWKINADGTGEAMLYHNKYGGDAKNFNCSYPQWSADGKKIYFQAISTNNKFQPQEIDSSGNNVKILKSDLVYTKLGQRETPPISNENGDLYVMKDNVKTLIFKHIGPYSQDFAYGSGAREASWSPDKQYVIFEADGYITIADLNGHITKLTKGNSPDWTY